MTVREKKAYSQWNKEMSTQGNMRETYFKQMQKLYEEQSGKKATCSLEANLNYLLESEDMKIRGQALNIYRKYWETSGQYTALLELGTALANTK